MYAHLQTAVVLLYLMGPWKCHLTTIKGDMTTKQHETTSTVKAGNTDISINMGSFLMDTTTAGKTDRSTIGTSFHADSTTEGIDNTTDQAEDSLSEQAAYLYQLSDDLFLVFSPIITIVGVVGNGVTVVIMTRKNLRHSTNSVYLAALAIADSLVLILDFINNWIELVTGVKLKSEADWFCKGHNFVFTAAYSYAAWLIVTISIERVIIVWLPFAAKRICTKKKALIVVSVLPVLFAILYCNNLWMWGLNPEGDCDVHVDHAFVMTFVIPTLNGIVYSYVPVIILVLSTILISVKLIQTNEAREQMGAEKMETRKITVTVIVVSVSYLLLTVPVTLFYVVLFQMGEFVQRSPRMALARTIVLLIGLCNHSINFFLYVITSRNFRFELGLLCGCGKTVPKTWSSGKSTEETRASSETGSIKDVSVSSVSLKNL